jgi:hypothetical protein
MRLNQVIALEEGSKSRANNELTKVYHTLQKPTLLEGLSRTYRPIAVDDGKGGKNELSEQLPPVNQHIQVRAEDILTDVSVTLAKWFDITATKDWTNTKAMADVVVDGKPLLTGVPVTYLMFLEKRLVDLHTLISKLPVLDPSEEWTKNDAQRAYSTKAQDTARTKKVPKPVVLYAATKEHPAQTQLLQEDVLAGYWTQIKYSGAVPQSRQKEMLDRVVKLQEAVKKAREEANQEKAIEQTIGNKLLGFLFA